MYVYIYIYIYIYIERERERERSGRVLLVRVNQPVVCHRIMRYGVPNDKNYGLIHDKQAAY